MSSGKVPGLNSPRVGQLLLDLICIQDQNHGHKDITAAIKKYKAILWKHNYMSPNDKAIMRAFDGLIEKVALSCRARERCAVAFYTVIVFDNGIALAVICWILINQYS